MSNWLIDDWLPLRDWWELMRDMHDVDENGTSPLYSYQTKYTDPPPIPSRLPG